MVTNEQHSDDDRQSAARFRVYETALAAVAEAVITVDRAERVVYLNRAAELMTGWTASEGVGKPLTQVCRLVDPVTGSPISHPLERFDGTTEGQGGVSSRCSLVDRSGAEWGVECRTVVLQNDAGTVDGAILCRGVGPSKSRCRTRARR
jgi:PAS domain S-box-containing protein